MEFPYEKDLGLILRGVDRLQEDLLTYERNFNNLVKSVEYIQIDISSIKCFVEAIYRRCEHRPHKFLIYYKGANMKKEIANSAVDYKLADDGNLIATLTVVDAEGLPTTWPKGSPIVWTFVDLEGVASHALVANPTLDGNPLTVVISPATPPSLVTGISPIATGTDNAGGQSFTVVGQGNPIDVIAGGPKGFTITEGPGSSV